MFQTLQNQFDDSTPDGIANQFQMQEVFHNRLALNRKLKFFSFCVR